MKFEDLVNEVLQLEKEQKEYISRTNERIAKINECIRVMKDEYRAETTPNVSSMTEYLLTRAKKRLGDMIIDACDIPEDVMDDFYEVTGRKVNTDKIVLAFQERHYVSSSDVLGKALCGNKNYWNGDHWFFFTDSELYLWEDEHKQFWCRYPYNSFIELRAGESSNTVKFDKTAEENGTGLYNLLYEPYGEQLVRLLLDLRDYAGKCTEEIKVVPKRSVNLPEDNAIFGDDPKTRDGGYV